VRVGRGDPVTAIEAVATRRHPSCSRVLVLAVSVLAIALAGTFAVRYGQARARLGHERARLAAATARLADTRAELDRTQRRTALTRAGVDLVGAEIELAVATRTWVEGATRNTQQAITGVEADRTETDTARFLVAAHANEVRSCLGGVSIAVGASRDGDVQSSASALRGAAGPCTRTLAYASGARFPYDFADPFVLSAGGAYYAYSTNAGAGDIQVIRSPDLVNWELVGNGLADVPRWAAADATWAPAVLARGNGYVAYYTVRHAASQRQCISRAVSARPAGPFIDDSAGPLVCQAADGGSIEPVRRRRRPGVSALEVGGPRRRAADHLVAGAQCRRLGAHGRRRCAPGRRPGLRAGRDRGAHPRSRGGRLLPVVRRRRLELPCLRGGLCRLRRTLRAVPQAR